MALINVVKFDGSPNVFVWKFPNDELGTWTQLIVNETQEAVLYKGGQALDLFGPGRHSLDTPNIPILNKLINLPFGRKSPFKAEVWYVNKITSLDIKWGTRTPIQLQDPKYKVFLPLRAFGQFGIQITDSKKFLMSIVGTLPLVTKEHIVDFFKGIYLTKVKDLIATYLVKTGISMLEINAYLEEISDDLRDKITPVFAEYGIKLVNFNVNDINTPEEDVSVKKLKEALAKKAEMDIIGFTYTQERSFDTLEGAAKNQSSGSAGMMGAGLGLGMGVGLGSNVGGQFANLSQNIQTQGKKKNCPVCQVEIEESQKFCSSCGANTEISAPTTHTCASCGRENANTIKFCSECGKKYVPCEKCGEDLKDNEQTCRKCGNKMAAPCPSCGVRITNSNAKFCPECGHSFVNKCECGVNLERGTKFCPECGKKVN